MCGRKSRVPPASHGYSSKSSHCRWPWLAPFFFLVFFLASPSLPAPEITEAELARLEEIFTTLEGTNRQLQESVSGLQLSLQKAETSLQEYAIEVQEVTRNRDCWRTAGMIGFAVGGVSLISLVLAFVLKGD